MTFTNPEQFIGNVFMKGEILNKVIWYNLHNDCLICHKYNDDGQPWDVTEYVIGREYFTKQIANGDIKLMD